MDIYQLSVFVTNNSFACEVGLKGLLRKNNKGIDLTKSYGHDLKKLFDNLLPYQQEFIKDEIDIVSSFRKAGDDFDSILEAVSNNFQEWRYVYESCDKNGNTKEYHTNYYFLYDFLNAIVSLWNS